MNKLTQETLRDIPGALTCSDRHLPRVDGTAAFQVAQSNLEIAPPAHDGWKSQCDRVFAD